MKDRLIGFIKTYCLFVCIFVLQKPLFMLFYKSLYPDASCADWFSVIWHGLPLDLSLAGYLTAIPGFLFITLKSATKLFSVLLASKRPLITELADKLRLKYPLLPTISPCPTMRLEAIRSIIPISCRRYPKSV